MRKAITEDGYTFTEQVDGSWTDGDMTFETLDELIAADLNITIEVVTCEK